MKKLLALVLASIVSLAAWAQMPHRESWMAGGDDGGSSLPTGSDGWFLLGCVLAYFAIMWVIPERHRMWVGPLLFFGPIVLATVALFIF